MASKGVKLASAQSSTIFAQSLIKMQFLATHEPPFHTMKSVCEFSTMVKVPGCFFNGLFHENPVKGSHNHRSLTG